MCSRLPFCLKKMLTKENGRFVYTSISLLMGRLSMEENKKKLLIKVRNGIGEQTGKSKDIMGKRLALFFFNTPFWVFLKCIQCT